MTKTAQKLFIEHLTENGLVLTPQRKIIAETFLESCGHFSAEQLCNLVRERAPEVGQATIYRALKLLVDSDLADVVDFGDGVKRYEIKYGRTHHDHLVCMKCAKKIEIMDDQIEHRQECIAQKNGFKLKHHRMYLYGLCSNCLNDDAKL